MLISEKLKLPFKKNKLPHPKNFLSPKIVGVVGQFFQKNGILFKTEKGVALICALTRGGGKGRW